MDLIVDQIIKELAKSGDTYHNRFSSDSPYKGNKKYKKLPRKCANCGTTSGQLDIDHKDGNRKNNNRSNLRVLCRSCHRKMHAKRNGGKGELIVSSAARIIEDPNTEASRNVAAGAKNSDVMHVEYILCHANTNGNKDTFTSADLKDSHQTIVNKPVNWEHKEKNIGVNYESKYIGIAELNEEDRNYYKEIDPLKYDFVVAKAAIWEYKFPTESNIMRERASKKQLFFSMENLFDKAECSECGETFESQYKYCDHLLLRRQQGNASRIFQGSNFIGSGVVKNPADRGSKHLALASKDMSLAFASLIGSKVMSCIDIKNSLIPYILKDENMKIRKLDVPQEFIGDASLPDDAFADEVNRCFPIHNCENIEASAKTVLNSDLGFYNDTEKLFVIERLKSAASEYDIKLNDYIDGGNMSLDINSPEFKKAVAEALNNGLKGSEAEAAIEEMQNQIKTLAKQADDNKKLTEQAQTEKAKAEKAFEDFKTDIKTKETIASRTKKLEESGYAFVDNKEFVDNSIATMKDEQFDSFISTLNEASKAAVNKYTEEKKKKEEEMKKNGKAKADVVKESQEAAIANQVDGTNVDKTAIDLVFSSVL